MLDLPPKRAPRKPSLTPMIDVVFLLLVFFMLASRFGTDMALPLKLAGSGGSYSGPPRIIDILPEDQRLNGVSIPMEALITETAALTEVQSDTIILRGRDGAVLQRIVDVMGQFQAAGYGNLVLVD
ncbi:MAG: biopolymer transporter ExbD [Mangrovicoccus sp.]|nr:biopolymer transporter ExbD [Mangrovicoccus sp.]